MADGIKVLATNRRAHHEYFIDETYEAGVALCGTEVKSVRLGKTNMGDGYCQVKNGELWMHSVHISPYEKGNVFNVDPLRDRKLLLHKGQIMRLAGLVQQKGFSVVPLRLYLKNGRVKLEIGVARGKKLYDKRQDLQEKNARRDMERAFASSRRYAE